MMRNPSGWARVVFGAVLAMVPAVVRADNLTQVWAIAPGDRLYVTTSNLERGVAINPANTNVLLVGRAGGPQVYVLSPVDGSDGEAQTGTPRVLSQLDAEGNQLVAGGTFALNLVGAAADGAVYACNLTTDGAATPFKVYRWGSDAVDAVPVVAFEGDPAGGLGGSGQDIRFGDNFAVRGSGLGTELVVSSRNGKYLTLFTTTDGTNFTARTMTTDALGKVGLAVTFAEGNSVWAKLNGQSLVRLDYDTTAGTARTGLTIPATVIAGGVTGIGYDPATKRLAAANYQDHTFSLFDMTNPAGPTRIGTALPFPATNANANGTASAACLGDRAVGLDSNNGLVFARVEVVQEPVTIDTQPASVTVLEGGTAVFSVVARGSQPIEYQWRDAAGDMPGRTNATLTLTNVTQQLAGEYSVRVKNPAGEQVSAIAVLTVVPLVKSDALTLKWKLAPGDRAWLNTDGTQRGLAYNPANGHLLVVSRTGAPDIYVVDGATGADVHTLNVDTAVVFGGTLPLNMIGVADDGVVYAGNLTTDGTSSTFNLYRWASDAPDAVPEAVFAGDPGSGTANRWGDTLDVRGSGVNTQILLSSRNGTAVALLTTADGSTFTAKTIDVTDATPGNFGLGLAFGSGNTFWGKAGGQSLRHVQFDPVAGTAATLHVFETTLFSSSVSPIAVDLANNFLAGLALENPDNARLYDIASLDVPPVLLDQEFMPADNPNVNATGAADIGGGTLFVLDSNNGIAAFAVKRPATAPTLANPRVNGANFEFTVASVAGATYVAQGAVDLGAANPWAEVGSPQAGTGAALTFSVPVAGNPYRFFRVKVQ